MNIESRMSANGLKRYYRFYWGKKSGEKINAGIFTWVRPNGPAQKIHNKEALELLEFKRSQLVIDSQSVGSGFIPLHRYKTNFLDFFKEYKDLNVRPGKRHLQSSYNHFLQFLAKKTLSPLEVTEDLCKRYRTYLLDRFMGETPMNYFSEFKRVIKAATKQGYFRINPAEEIKAKTGKQRKLKELLEVDEYLELLNTPCLNNEVREAFILCCYTGLRWVDIKSLSWEDIQENNLRTRLIQAKTGLPVVITMHPVAMSILTQRFSSRSLIPNNKVFQLPTHDGANKILSEWVIIAGVNKYITWSSARLSFSILLQDKRVPNATVALLLGHASTKYVDRIYKRHRLKDQTDVIAELPSPI